MLKKIYLIFYLFLLLGLTMEGGTINSSLYLNKGTFVTVNTTSFPYVSFNHDRTFNAMNAVINITTQDELILKVVNTDSVIHGFDISGYGKTPHVIAPGDSITDTLQFTTQGVFIYYDSYENPKFRYMGGAGMICVNNSVTDKKFYWNLKEHQSSYNELLDQNKPVNWSEYAPDYFTINSFSFPLTLDDPTSIVSAKIGDTVHIFIANTGQSAHAIHFHGFHCKIIFSSNSSQIGWVKDTFPLKSMQTMVLELIPDKLGRYSVHDHNLIAVTGGGQHPKG
ncbi:MAG TPA: multicopper oxidase domain-containing protein, partial [Bacteroidia bacterium]|nr:multicopper oxidase domain-containing protein [Bacteroidia bacterium]